MTELLTVDDAAAYLGMKTSWLREHTEVPRVKLGHLVRYRRADLDAYVEERLVRAKSGRSVRSKRRLRA